MATPLRIAGLLAKAEAVYNTDPTPTTTDDGVRLSEISSLWSTLRLTHRYPNRRDDVANGSIIPPGPGNRVGRIVEMSIVVDATGFGAAYSAANKPQVTALMRATQHSETVDTTASSESVTYAPVSTSHESATVWAYAGGELWKVTGCRGTMAFIVNAGQLIGFRFDLTGILSAEPTTVALPAITYTAQVPPAAVGATLTIGGVSFDTFTAEFTQNAEVQVLDDVTATDGVSEVACPEMLPALSVTARLPSIATYNRFSKSHTPTGETVAVAIGSTQYNRVKLNATSAAYLEDPENAADGKFVAVRLPYQLTDYEIVFD